MQTIFFSPICKGEKAMRPVSQADSIVLTLLFQTVSGDLGVHKLPGGRSSPVDHRPEDSNPQIKVQQHLHVCISGWLQVRP